MKYNYKIIIFRARIFSALSLLSCIALPLVKTSDVSSVGSDHYLIIFRFIYSLHEIITSPSPIKYTYFWPLDTALMFFFIWPSIFMIIEIYAIKKSSKINSVLFVFRFFEIIFLAVTALYTVAFSYLLFNFKGSNFYIGSTLAVVSFSIYFISTLFYSIIYRKQRW